MSRSTKDGDGATLSVFARAMQTLGRPSKLIDFPGVEGLKVRLWCPTDSEEAQADVESRKYLTVNYKLSALELSVAQETELARRERELELLALILRDPNDPTQAFVESVDELRDPEHGIEKPQREALIATMEDYRRERFQSRTPEESAEIVRLMRGLGETGALSAYWRCCEPDTQLCIVRTLIEALPKPTAPSSSAT